MPGPSQYGAVFVGLIGAPRPAPSNPRLRAGSRPQWYFQCAAIRTPAPVPPSIRHGHRARTGQGRLDDPGNHVSDLSGGVQCVGLGHRRPRAASAWRRGRNIRQLFVDAHFDAAPAIHRKVQRCPGDGAFPHRKSPPSAPAPAFMASICSQNWAFALITDCSSTLACMDAAPLQVSHSIIGFFTLHRKF